MHSTHLTVNTYPSQFIAKMCRRLHTKIANGNGRCQVDAGQQPTDDYAKQADHTEQYQ